MKEIFDRVSVRKYTVQPVETEKWRNCCAPQWLRLRQEISSPGSSASCAIGKRSISSPHAALTPNLARRAAGHRDPKPRGGLAFPGILGTGPGRVHAESAAGSGALGLGAVWMGIAPLQDRMEKVSAVLSAVRASSPLRWWLWAIRILPSNSPNTTAMTRARAVCRLR